jgi:uncharacterized coiled-coil protein SlyX
MAKRKVHVPKVVVQTNPPNRRFLALLVFAAFLAITWLSYDLGRSQSQPGGIEIATDEQALQRIAELEKENAALQKQIDGLQRDVRKGREALETARSKMRGLEQAPVAQTAAKPLQTPAAETPVATTVPVPLDNRLVLQDVRVGRTADENRFRFSFTVLNAGDPDDQVVGTIWIAVNGMQNGNPRRLPLNEVSSSTRPFVKMDFRARQVVEGELRLPPAFTPKNISIEAKPYSKKYHEATDKVDWVTSG